MNIVTKGEEGSNESEKGGKGGKEGKKEARYAPQPNPRVTICGKIVAEKVSDVDVTIR